MKTIVNKNDLRLRDHATGEVADCTSTLQVELPRRISTGRGLFFRKDMRSRSGILCVDSFDRHREPRDEGAVKSDRGKFRRSPERNECVNFFAEFKKREG
jgi:hypothetical protein